MKKHPTLPITVSEDGKDIFNIESNRWLSVYKWANGYRACKINYKQRPVHRLVAETYLDNKENFKVVHHKDNDKANNNVSNLEWTTHSKNTQMAYNDDKIARNGKPRSVSYIDVYDTWNTGEMNKAEIARQYGITPTTVGRIITYMDIGAQRG